MKQGKKNWKGGEMKFKDILFLLWIVFCLSMAIVMAYTFSVAYSTEEKETLVTINELGEAVPEFILMIVWGLLTIYFLFVDNKWVCNLNKALACPDMEREMEFQRLVRENKR